MNRFIPAVPVVLVLSAWSVAARAADEAPSAAPAATKAVVTEATRASAARAIPTGASTATTSDPSAQHFVCLKESHQCFTMKPKADDAAAKAKAASLDLKAPDIHRVVPEVVLREPLQEPTEVEVEQVQIEGSRPDTYVPGGIASLPWAVMHPTQAWRIFLPVPPGVAK